MIFYVDASVLLRVGLEQPGALREWRKITHGVSSALIKTECLRTLDRIHLREQLEDSEFAERRGTVLELIETLEIVGLNGSVLGRASQPMPTELGTLGAIHLATAILWRESTGSKIVMATHDITLAIAARAHGFAVVGVTLQ